MESVRIQEDINIMGNEVASFPEGITQAFDALLEKIPGGFNRPYYGVCFSSERGLVYIAGVEQHSPGEANALGLRHYKISKGNYASITVKDWRTKTNLINDIFHSMLEDETVDNQSPSVEWYKNEDEMVCMVKLRDEIL